MFVSQESTLDGECAARSYGSLAEGLIGEIDHFLSERPLHVSAFPDRWRVRVLRFLEIEADAARRELRAYWVNAQGLRGLIEVRVRRNDRASELPRFWIDWVVCSPWWLRFAAARWFPGAIEPAMLETFDACAPDVEAALARAYDFLQHDARFVALRRELPRYLGPCAHIASLTERVCGSRARSSRSIEAWWPAMDHVAWATSESPQLLALCLAYAGSVRSIDAPTTIVGAVRACLRDAGLSKSRWRALAREGDKWLDRAWAALCDATDVGPWSIATSALLMRQRVGEVPVSVAALRLWMSIHPPCESLGGSGNETWAELPASFLREALVRAPSRRDADTGEWLAECDAIARWLLATAPAARAARARRPWGAMLETARTHARRQELTAEARGVALPFDAPTFDAVEGFELQPVDTALKMLDEGWRMRHCAWTYIAAARAGTVLVWRVRRDGSDVGTLCVTRAKIDAPWNKVQVRGVANAAPTEAMQRLADEVLSECATWWYSRIFDDAVAEVERERQAGARAG